LELDLSGRDLQSGSNDLIFLYASVIDDAGTVVPDPDMEILFTLEGDAQFIGPNPAWTEAGITAILLKAGNQPGSLKIHASSWGLSPESIQVEMEAVH
jgi:beta-galactosidase